MPKRLADMRSLTMADAERLHEAITTAKLRIERRAARANVVIQREKSRVAADTVGDAATIALLEPQLLAFIATHEEQFEKPKQHVTPSGKFGLRKVTDTVIDDEGAFVAWAALNGRDDLIEVVKSPAKNAIRARLQDEEDLPHCELRTGNVATYSIDRALLAEARDAEA